MHKNILVYSVVLLVVYFTLVFCEETENTETQIPDSESIVKNDSGDLTEVEGRTRRHRHHLFWYRHLWPLAIAYWIKVKVVIVSFFVGSAIYLGLRYFWPHKCHSEIILDHPPPSFGHHDHIPYSLDHSEHHGHYDAPTSFDSSSFDPYSGYSGYSSSSDIVSDTSSFPTAPSDVHDRRSKRNVDDTVEQEVEEEADEEISESVARQMPAEEQIADFMFAFLGLDSKACRRRFVCEMEFRSKLNPLTSMAFRIVGKGFFDKYTNARNPQARATKFDECAVVNSECVFIETQDQPAEDENETVTDATVTEQVIDSEAQNEKNLEDERRHANLKKRRAHVQRRSSFSPIAEHILMQTP